MPPPWRRAHDQGMSSDLHHDGDERARMHDAANRDRFATRRTLRAMDSELKRLEREARDFDVRQQRTKDAIDEIWLVEHWGLPPLKPPPWQANTTGDEQ
jgi:hypothetical protein